ncbi:hypothetical protein TVAG_291550 [Trichomonas vaginalis G3]|uniref:Uncharacterized protein n=1 Tax=Trichomonas vaginalis (strain ATCC PRA-98 / G3) TaxID=412133 RepID=A2DQT6_TRIV3|nr:spectrin binding [Trichomonas vaginalis G3]EAY17203.1 hypothetical protein TVAG_291550 [Trichomonas vaginalis G3]KAI5486264.1 spectrin binding [Trichomonas vaginalis G3]|eukprot:XP_001329426.1 hypothetical protein [Trichomonas vaginalis G3]
MFEQWRLSIAQNDFPLFVELSQLQNIETVKGGGQIRVRDYIFDDLNIFFYCIFYRRPIFVEHCLSEGVNVNITTSNGWSPLFIAIALEYAEIVEILIFYGANINTPNKYDITPLQFAIQMKNIEIVKIILKSRQQVTDLANTLASAIVYDQTEIVEILIKMGADPFTMTKKGVPAIQLVSPTQINILHAFSNRESDEDSCSYEESYEEEISEPEEPQKAEEKETTEMKEDENTEKQSETKQEIPNFSPDSMSLNELLEMVKVKPFPPITPTYPIEFL